MNILLSLLPLLLTFSTPAQEAKKTSPPKDGEYLKGIYIPKDLDDCLRQFDKNWSQEMKDTFKKTSEDLITRKYTVLQEWMMDNWGLWGESRLRKYFHTFGMYHPEDMASMILISYHRHINGKEIRLADQIQFYRDYWQLKERSRPDITPEKLREEVRKQEKKND
jgi:hypothetical protein